MSQFVLFGVLGLGSGAVLALLALGIVIGYRGSGIVNFGQGGVAMYVAYTFLGLRSSGRYFLPIPGLPGWLTIGPSSGLGTVPSILIALLTAVALGLLTHYLVFRPLRDAPPLGKVVASVGILLILQSVVAYRFGTTPQNVPNILTQANAFTLLGVDIPMNRLILVGVAVVIAAVSWVGYRYTRFGLATRAAAESEKGAGLLGYSVDYQAGVNWIFAAVISGIGGIVIAPLTTLTPTEFTFLVIPALAATLVGKLSSIGLTVGAALFIGMAQSELTNLPTKVAWFPSVGTQDAFPFVLIIIVMFVFGRSLPTRGSTGQETLPVVPPASRRLISPLVAFSATTLLLYTLPGSYRLSLINSIIGGILCLSLVVLVGYMGQISLFVMALSGVSAFLLAELGHNLGIPFPFAPLVAALGATLAGIVAAVPALRVRGVNLAIVTLAGGWAIEQMYFNNPNYTGGQNGAIAPTLDLFGLHLPFSAGSTIAQPGFGLMVLIVFAVIAVLVSNVRRSKTGRQMLAVRQNERAAASVGVNVARTKIVGFGISAFIAGVGGTLLAYQQTNLSPTSFDAVVSVTFVATAYLGGITSISGAAVGGIITTGGIFFVFLNQVVFSHSSNGLELQDLISGVGLILTAILNPQGIAGALRLSIGQVRGRFGTRKSSRLGGVWAWDAEPVGEELSSS